MAIHRRFPRPHQRWAMMVLLLMAGMLALDVSVAQAQTSTIKCGAGIDIAGFSQLLGTLWGYAAGPVGKVLAIIIFLVGATSIITRHFGAGIAALVASFLIAFAPSIIGTLFTQGQAIAGTGVTC
jgi:hypothetical protein